LKIMISGRHVDVTDSMKVYARAKVEKLIEVNRGVTLVGKAEAPDMYAACDLAEQKLAQQLRKYKERLTDHHRGEKPAHFDVSAPTEAPVEREDTYEDVIEQMRRGE
jgi:putative sigma-54 modulation protein